MMNILIGIWSDLIHAGQSLAKARAFTFVCVVTLGVGMAPIIAIHNGMRVFTTPPPGVNTEGLVELVTTRIGRHGATDKWSYADFVDLRDAATGVSMIGWAPGNSQITLPGGAKTTSQAMFVSSNYFPTVGVALARGPGFQESADPVVILGYAFWQNRLASDPDIVGKTLTLAGVPHVVAGIAPDRFAGHLVQDAELFIPLEEHPSLRADVNARFNRSKSWVRIHGRLSPGVGIAQASAAVSAVTSQLAKANRSASKPRSAVAVARTRSSDITVAAPAAGARRSTRTPPARCTQRRSSSLPRMKTLLSRSEGSGRISPR